MPRDRGVIHDLGVDGQCELGVVEEKFTDTRGKRTGQKRPPDRLALADIASQNPACGDRQKIARGGKVHCHRCVFCHRQRVDGGTTRGNGIGVSDNGQIASHRAGSQSRKRIHEHRRREHTHSRRPVISGKLILNACLTRHITIADPCRSGPAADDAAGKRRSRGQLEIGVVTGRTGGRKEVDRGSGTGGTVKSRNGQGGGTEAGVPHVFADDVRAGEKRHRADADRAIRRAAADVGERAAIERDWGSAETVGHGLNPGIVPLKDRVADGDARGRSDCPLIHEGQHTAHDVRGACVAIRVTQVEPLRGRRSLVQVDVPVDLAGEIAGGVLDQHQIRGGHGSISDAPTGIRQRGRGAWDKQTASRQRRPVQI